MASSSPSSADRDEKQAGCWRAPVHCFPLCPQFVPVNLGSAAAPPLLPTPSPHTHPWPPSLEKGTTRQKEKPPFPSSEPPHWFFSTSNRAVTPSSDLSGTKVILGQPTLPRIVQMTQVLFNAIWEPCEVFGEAPLKNPPFLAEETGRSSQLPKVTQLLIWMETCNPGSQSS